ncbi:hypothetical protein GRS48_06545 [Halorubrum sp. JWXQ-INN 858]|uniref:hypothetical protein n=1 Tax=Halorubrum sp. JWXQ-INN 858 TaxID=2690782 RepID=UPI001359D8BC|nr:hypothetical protein [Halorubrum sp. JWXQ-INN 858]MWV64483.1 hypothetical protein [Halorubrum sp. JWXQ-INN 858]
MVDSTYEKDLVLAASITILVGALSHLDLLTITPISPALAAGIFTVIVGTMGTLFSIISLYGEVIAAAKEKSETGGAESQGDNEGSASEDATENKKNFLRHLKRTFSVPVKIAVSGFIIAVLSNIYKVNIPTDVSVLFTINEWFSLMMTFLLMYAILSFWEAFSFVLRTVLLMESSSE